jgi:hypothetical protein
MRRKVTQRVVRGGAWVVLLAAMLPNILYIGHWPTAGAAEGHTHTHPPLASSATEHAAHCHGDTSQCDAPALVLVTWVPGESSPPEPPVSVLIPPLPAVSLAPADEAIDVATPPPRRAA